MKQTNNAIKFLMAQYRAIFKNAYFKGLTSALVLTAGLTVGAGQVQAAGSNFVTTPATAPDLIINGDGVFVNGNNTASTTHSDATKHNIEYTTSGSASALVGKNVTVEDGGILQSDPTNPGQDNLYILDTLTINDGGKLILTGAETSNPAGGIQGHNGTDTASPTSGSFIVNAGGEVSVTRSQIQMGDIDINGESATVTVGGNMGLTEGTSSLGIAGDKSVIGTTASLWKDNAMIYGGNSLSLRNGAVANINAGGQMLGLNVTVSNATVNLAGTSGLDGTNGALLMAAASASSGASLSLTGATVNVQSEDEDVNYTGHILISPTSGSGASISATNTTFTIGAGDSLLIGVAPSADGTATAIGSRTAGNLEIGLNTGTIINNEGTVELTEVTGADFSSEFKYVKTTLANGATINNSTADSAFVIEAGNRFVINGGVINNSGLIDIQSGAVASAEEQASNNPDGTVITDGVTTLGGNINVGGILKVGAGSTLEIASGSNVSTNTTNSAAVKIDEGTGNGSIQVIGAEDSGAAVLKIDSATLKSFLTAGDTALVGNGVDTAGALYIRDGIVDLGTAATLNDFKYANTSGDGQVQIAAGYISTLGQATITADTLTITDALKVGTIGNGSDKLNTHLTVEADTLKIAADTQGVSNINSATNKGALGFKEAIVHSNLDVQYAGNTQLQVGDSYYLDAYTEAEDGSYVPANGTITGKAFTLANGGKLNFRAGNWTADQAITLQANATDGSEGSINVTTQVASGDIITDNDSAPADKDFLLTSTNVKLNGLVFDVTAASTPSGNPNVTVSNSSEANRKGFTATLDLTSGISVIADGTQNGKGEIIADGKGAKVLLTGENVTGILNDQNVLHHVGLAAHNAGTIEATSAVSANYGDLKSGSDATVASGALTFSGNGVFKAPTLTLNGTSATENGTKLDIGAGTINVNSLVLNDSNTAVDSSTTLQSGSINVTSSLRAQSDILNISGAHVTLDTGADETAGALSINDLNISAGAFNVAQGEWNASTSDINVSETGSLNIGNTNNDTDSASFTANRLTVTGDSASVNVYDLGNVTLTAADLQDAAAGSVTVNGQMTVVGAVLDMDNDKTKNENHHGLYFGEKNDATGIFNVDGGHLTFGSEATKTFYDTALQESGAAVNNEDGTLNYRLPYVAEDSQDRLTVSNGGEVELTFADGTAFNRDQILSLKEQLFAEIGEGLGSTKLDGFLNIGNAAISGIDSQIVDGAISWSALEPYTDIIWDATNTKLSTAKVTGVDYTSQIGGHFGSIEAVNGTEAVTIASNTILSNAAGNNGNFIDTVDGTVIGATVTAEQILTLEGAGNVGKITLQAGSDNDETGVEFDATASGDAITVQGAITGPVDGNTYTLFKGEGTTTVQGNITVGSVGVAGNLVAQGDITSDEMWVDGSLTAEKSVTTNGIDAKNGATVSVAGDMTLGSSSTQGHAYADIEDSSKIAVAGDLTVYGGTIRVGSDDITHTQYVNATQPDGSNPYNGYVDAADETVDGQISNTASTGYLEVLGETSLNGATVFVDPTYGLNTSLATFATFADSSVNHGQLGVLDGNIVVGKNAAVGLGLTNAELAERIAQFQTNGSLNEGLYGSILYVNGQVNVADGQYIAINGNANNKTVEQINADFGNNTADLRLGSNTALIISDNAVQAAANSRDTNRNAAIEFNKAGATVYAQTDAAVLLDGTTFSLNELKLFDDADGNGVTLTSEDGQGLYVGTVSGLFEAWMDDGEAGTIKLSITRNGLENTALSYPVKDSLYAVLGDTVKTETLPPTEGEGSTEGAGGEAARVAGELGTEGSTGEGTGTPEPTPVITEVNKYKLDQGSFLATALAEQASLQSVEQAARLGVYAGVAQATLGATNTTTEAISGRMGVGAQSGTITYADNGQGAGLWLSPVYKNHSSDGFDAEGADYGVDMDLYGLALGADYTLANGVRIGAMFNVGSGDADGNGVASGVSNDFDYYGFGVYGGYTMGALSVVADVTYTAVDNDFDSSTGLTNYSKLEGSADSDALSIGVTGQYEFATQSMTVTPHAGLRFTKVSMDDYTVKAGGTNIADFEADDMNVFSIPVGVTFASEFTSGDWSVQPSLDVTLTANAGDTDLDGDSRWLGTDNGFGEMTYGVSTEVLDDFTYGATLGIAAKTGGFSLGLGVNYTGSSNVDEFGVNANARFVF